MRRGELINLEWKLVDLHKLTAYLPAIKNGSLRTVPLSAQAFQLITQMERSGEQLFELVGDSVGQAFSWVTSRAGIKDLRHEATSRLFKKGLQLVEVAAITGHKYLAMLKQYIHLDVQKLAIKLSQYPCGGTGRRYLTPFTVSLFILFNAGSEVTEDKK